MLFRSIKLEDLKAEKEKNENNPEALKVIKEKEEILISLAEINKIKDDLKALGRLYGEPRRDIKEYRDLMDKLDALTVEVFKGKKEAVSEKEKVLAQLKEMREKLDKDVMAQITEVVLKKSEKETEILNKLETLLQNGNLSEKDKFVYKEELKNIKLELLKAESFKTDGNSENEIAPPLPPRGKNIIADNNLNTNLDKESNKIIISGVTTNESTTDYMSTQGISKKYNENLEMIETEWANKYNKEALKDISNEIEAIIKKLNKDLENLLSKQNELIEKQKKQGKLGLKEKNKLEKIEESLKKTLNEQNYYKNLEIQLKNDKTPLKNNNNLESNITSKILGETPLLYGLSAARKYVYGVAEESLNKNPLVADNYVGKLHQKDVFKHFNHLYDFASKVTENNLTQKDIDDIIRYTFPDPTLSATKTIVNLRAPNVDSEANRELIKIFLENQEIKETLKGIAEKYPIAIKESNYDDLNKLYRKFFGLKTKIILEKTLERNGQIYFTLDNLITNPDKGIDFSELITVFDKNNKYYDKVTSQELRFVLTKYPDNPNLKFMIHDQVVELPDYIKEQIKKITANESEE